MDALAITSFGLSTSDLHISSSVEPYFGSKWAIFHLVDFKKSSSNVTSFDLLYVLFSPSDSLTSTGTFDDPATTEKSDMFNDFLISSRIGRSVLIVPLISYPPVTLSGCSEVMSSIPFKIEKIIRVKMIRANIATVKPVRNFEAMG